MAMSCISLIMEAEGRVDCKNIIESPQHIIFDDKYREQ